MKKIFLSLVFVSVFIAANAQSKETSKSIKKEPVAVQTEVKTVDATIDFESKVNKGTTFKITFPTLD